jgi:pimeloyl-ACP methyl ester carboxylesterase
VLAHKHGTAAQRRRAIALLVAFVAAAVGCGDDINEATNVGGQTRGTVAGVELDTPEAPDVSYPDPLAEYDDIDSYMENPSDPLDDFEDPYSAPGEAIGAIQWVELESGLDDGYLTVPLDYDDPNGETIDLYLTRHRAQDPDNRIGSLLVNPGGPGVLGSSLAYAAEAVYGQDLLDRFDIIGWDPRGTGYIEYVDCIEEYTPYFGIDSSPDNDLEWVLLSDAIGEFTDGCSERSERLLPHVSTMNSARDMDAIRDALGEDTISYFGFSYGSELGATWATMFPTTVRAAVLDGAVDPTVAYFEQNLQQAAGFEAAFNTFLADCAADERCAFHNDGNTFDAFDELAEDIGNLHPTAIDEVSDGVLYTAIAAALYSEGQWRDLEQALADAQEGDYDGLRALWEQYYELESDGYNYTDTLEAYFAINCLDDPGTTSIDELRRREPELQAAAPRLGRSWLLELAMCAQWTERPTESIVITGAGAGPVLVVGTTGDAATPLASTQAMADALEDGRLVVVTANQHTGYGVNGCVNDAVEAYLINPSNPPKDGLTCP